MSQRSGRGRGVKPVGTKSQVWPKKISDCSPKPDKEGVQVLLFSEDEGWRTGIQDSSPTLLPASVAQAGYVRGLKIENMMPSESKLFLVKFICFGQF